MKTKKLTLTRLFLFTIVCHAPLLFNFIGPDNDIKNDKKKKECLEPADKMAKPEVKKVYNWAYNINRNQSDRIISGQYSYASCEAIATQTGKWPALLEVNFWQRSWPARTDDWTTGWERAAAAKQHCLDYWEKGGLISIHMPVPNPFNRTNQHDTSKPENENWDDIFVPGTNAYNNLIEWVDILASHLQWLQDKGIVAFIRPFHENTGRWFWYGIQSYNGEKFAKLYQWFFNYLTQEKQLHNLLYVYSPNVVPDGGINVMDWYPGDKYVDIIGIDSYSNPILRDVKAINDIKKASVKPFGISELGWRDGGPPEYNEIDSREYLNAIKEKAPHAFYFTIWSGRFAPGSQKYTKELYDDPWIVARDEVNWREYNCGCCE